MEQQTDLQRKERQPYREPTFALVMPELIMCGNSAEPELGENETPLIFL